MLNQFVNIINSADIETENDRLLITNHIIDNLECLRLFDAQNCINSVIKNGNIVILDDLNIGDTVSIELSLLHLSSIGYYEDIDAFIRKNLYSIPLLQCYIRDINCFNTNSNNHIINSYSIVVLLIDIIKKNAKHNYSETNIDYSFISQEDKVLLLLFKYDSNDIKQIKNNDIETLNEIINALDEKNIDKKQRLIFINELVDFLKTEDEENRFRFLLSNISIFLDRAKNVYQYYIRNFSYNKLKAELDKEALEYSKKIQSIINEAQTKLIAIPTAFVLATTSVDFDKVLTNKNIGIICSLFIFSYLIELFIKNQKSALMFIKHNIDVYKQSFDSMNEVIKESFSLVDSEWDKQNNRIKQIQFITWLIPILLTIVLAILFFKQNSSIIDTIIKWGSKICQK
ncbi:MAG: hypothetical protein LBC85_03895 [Fibromonadaceae bacterium]|jgi:hypothetical protein|nr:hypothetical protein [Fibromonadaceae bacterium]